MLILYSLVFVAGLIITRLLMPLCIRASNRLGYIDKPNTRKLHIVPVPYGGGVCIFLSLSLMISAMFLYCIVGRFAPEFSNHFIDINIVLKDERALAFLLGALGIFLLGLVDDILDLSAKLKLFLQTVIIASVLYFSGMTMSFFIPIPWVGFIGTLLWVILITNAFNLLDNMDGLCSGVTLITLFVHFILLYKYEQYLVALLTLVVCAPLLIFFMFNKPPAKVYLGDAGSLMLGFIVAMLSVMSTYYRDGQHLSAIFTPILILAIPLFDVCTVMFIRYKLGTPFFKADKNHFSHRLLDLGMSQNQVLYTIMTICLVMSLGALMLTESSNFNAVVILIQGFLVFIVIIVLERASAKQVNDNIQKESE